MTTAPAATRATDPELKDRVGRLIQFLKEQLVDIDGGLPSPAYHGMKFFETFGPMKLAYLLKVRTHNTASLERLLARIQAWSGVVATRTNVVLSTSKETLRIKVEATK